MYNSAADEEIDDTFIPITNYYYPAITYTYVRAKESYKSETNQKYLCSRKETNNKVRA